MRLTFESDDKIQVAVTFDRWDGDRVLWHWSIACAGEELASATDLRSGAGDRVNAASALGSLASFLGAWAESDPETGENRDLFPESLRGFVGVDWQSLAYEIGEAVGEE